MTTEEEWKTEVERIKDLIPYWEAIPHPQAVINTTFIKHLVKSYESGDRSQIRFEQMKDVQIPSS
ncbi:hypothetical protein BKP37_12880 [Anaerobacillus alkalilacustris]|uniref:Uncharacterized protein n=1 Tax=Anaerobacillus alkalilacustris TaxID=393763 RepID=A0A1S2LJI0_9BACI|nr:hypothetical protein [Anaerobacillus alkalilacustris]OIJ12689.1 hypothetical protein BKP37_12880 [Anaerobacillus alkalilacustris]